MKNHRLTDVNLKIFLITDGKKIPVYQLLRPSIGVIIESVATTQDYVWTTANC